MTDGWWTDDSNTDSVQIGWAEPSIHVHKANNAPRIEREDLAAVEVAQLLLVAELVVDAAAVSSWDWDVYF